MASGLANLAAHECLIYTGRVVADWLFNSGKRSISIRPKRRIRSDGGEAMLLWAIAGLGITEAPSFMVSDAIASGSLEPLLLDYPVPEYAIYVVRPPGAYVPGKVRILIDTLIESFAGEPEWERFLTKSVD
jgi:DNA-binding transcriptional LysR family regulator